MNKGAEIDYEKYAIFMRKQLSGSQICNEDGSLNHIYFNTKKGFYWSEEHNELLRQGLIKCGLDFDRIKKEIFNNTKTQVEIQLRACILLGVKQSSKITEKQLGQLNSKTQKKNKVTINANGSKKK